MTTLTRRRALSPLEKLKKASKGMYVRDALEHAFDVIEELSGQDDKSCHWPDIHLTPQQRSILQLLYKNENRTVTFEMLMASVYMHDVDRSQIGSIRVQLHKIRKAIRSEGVFIVPIHSIGLKFTRSKGTVFPWEEPKEKE